MRTLATLLRAPSEAYDGLAAEAALAKAVEDLARTVEVHRGADARGDRAVREHARNLASPSGVKEGFAPGEMLCAVIWRSANHPSFAA